MSYRGVFRRYEQHTDEILAISHDTQPYLDFTGTTLTTAAASNVDTGLNITAQAQTTAGWSCNANATAIGSYAFELRLTYSNGTRQVLEFQIDVVNPR